MKMLKGKAALLLGIGGLIGSMATHLIDAFGENRRETRREREIVKGLNDQGYRVIEATNECGFVIEREED